MRRWHMRGVSDGHFVEWNGKPIISVKAALRSAVRLAAG
jgi:hypothetical protein